MKNLLLFFLFLLLSAGSAGAVTAFTVSVKQSGGDYSTLNAAMVANEVDLTASSTGVFSITGGITGTMTDNTAVTGLSSGATGTCVHASSVNGQILIKSISGTFQSGEIVYETLGTNYVTLSSVRASPYLNVVISGTWSSPDTTPCNITGYTTSATNNINISATGSSRHNGTVGANNYVLACSNAQTCFSAGSGNLYLVIDGLIFYYSIPSSYIVDQGALSSGSCTPYWTIKNNIFYFSATGAYYNDFGIEIGGQTTGGTVYIYNNVFYGFQTNQEPSYKSSGISYGQASGTAYIYSNTFYNNQYGIYQSNSSTVVAKNNLSYNNTTDDYFGTFSSSSTNNLSKDSTAPAYNTYYASATVTFVNAGSNNFNLASTDTGATGHGANLSSDSNLPFSNDIIGTTRTVPWDIGAFKAPTSVTNSNFLPFLSMNKPKRSLI